MRRSLPKPSTRYPLDLVTLARLFQSRLTVDEQLHYETYVAHVRDDDFVAATAFAEERANPMSWVDATPAQYAVVRQAYSLHEKLTCEGDLVAEKRAWQKFLRCEARCARANRKIRYLRLFPHRLRKVSGGRVTLGTIDSIRRDMRRILGDFWPSYANIAKDMAFGKGMSLSSIDGMKTSVPFKLCDEVTVTKSALPVWRDFLKFGGFTPEWTDIVRSGSCYRFKERVQIVPGCRVTFVPKTSVIKRTIAIEPSANVSMQLAIHRHLKRRLKLKAGIDITDQTRNRQLALVGSKDGSLCTLDLSSASDLISMEVIKYLLPREWYELLSCLRSSQGQYKDQTVHFEKFSSMGNGFTFALETALFYCITRSVCRVKRADLPSVYGDDIIAENQDYDSICAALKFFGFKVNHLKSFSTGPFRESCGLDAFKGEDVRPIFVSGKTLTLVELYALHNHFFRRADYRVCEYLVSCLPEKRRLFGPEGPEGGFLFSKDPGTLERSRKWHRDTQSWTYLGYAEKGRRLTFSERLLLEASLCVGGIFSSGAPLRSVTKLITVTAHRDY